MVKRLDFILKNYRAFLFRIVLNKLEQNTHNISLLKNHTEEDDLYKYIFEDNNDIRLVVPKKCKKEFVEVLNHLLDHYEKEQEYEKCENIFNLMKSFEK